VLKERAAIAKVESKLADLKSTLAKRDALLDALLLEVAPYRAQYAQKADGTSKYGTLLGMFSRIKASFTGGQTMPGASYSSATMVRPHRNPTPRESASTPAYDTSYTSGMPSAQLVLQPPLDEKNEEGGGYLGLALGLCMAVVMAGAWYWDSTGGKKGEGYMKVAVLDGHHFDEGLEMSNKMTPVVNAVDYNDAELEEVSLGECAADGSGHL